jgi:soluble lytic murein transglycosylase-like protein
VKHLMLVGAALLVTVSSAEARIDCQVQSTAAMARLLGFDCFAHRASSGAVNLLTPPVEIRRIVERLAPQSGLEIKLVMAVIAAESAFNARAISPRNAQGLMQLMPETAARFGVQDPFDAEDNIRGGTIYLQWLLKQFDGDLDLALAAYNAGEGAVTAYGAVPPFDETIDYISRVKHFYRLYDAAQR